MRVHLLQIGLGKPNRGDRHADDDIRHSRQPRWLYRVGSDPDPRFSLANERNLLAWIRTAVAFAAGGGGALLVRDLIGIWASVVAAGAFGLAGVVVAGAMIRWLRTERALRRGDGLPSPWLAGFAVGAVIVGAIVGVVVATAAT